MSSLIFIFHYHHSNDTTFNKTEYEIIPIEIGARNNKKNLKWVHFGDQALRQCHPCYLFHSSIMNFKCRPKETSKLATSLNIPRNTKQTHQIS